MVFCKQWEAIENLLEIICMIDFIGMPLQFVTL